jgi:hypothetical protein
VTSESPPRRGSTVRRLGAVPWAHDGHQRLAIWADGDVPRFDDPMIRSALTRCAHISERLKTLERSLNRELWPLGYAASIEAAVREGTTADIVITGTR